jgi:hypothetical protein
MPLQVTIQSVTANTPVDIYVCNSLGLSCTYVSTVATFPYTFTVSDVYATTNFIIKIDDTQGCIETQTIQVTPTPTPTLTPSQTVTPSVTPTNTPTTSSSPTPTRTNAVSHTPTRTVTPTPTSTPFAYSHYIGRFLWDNPDDACSDTMTVTQYYTYFFDTPTIPVVGSPIYQNIVAGILVNPVNQNSQWRKLQFGSSFYAVQINTSGIIIDFQLCS